MNFIYKKNDISDYIYNKFNIYIDINYFIK